MKCIRVQLLLCLSWCFLCLVQSAQVYMEFNGVKYSYNTDRTQQQHANDLSPNYELQSHHWPYSSTSSRRNHWDWTQQPQQERQQHANTSPAAPHNIDFSTQHMSHTQHTDESGIVLGKYSYYDAAGYHELSYKAGAGIGFVVMGGNLAKPTTTEQSEHTVTNLHSY